MTLSFSHSQQYIQQVDASAVHFYAQADADAESVLVEVVVFVAVLGVENGVDGDGEPVVEGGLVGGVEEIDVGLGAGGVGMRVGHHVVRVHARVGGGEGGNGHGGWVGGARVDRVDEFAEVHGAVVLRVLLLLLEVGVGHGGLGLGGVGTVLVMAGDGGFGTVSLHADEAALNAFGEGFEEVGEAPGEVDVVNGGGAEGFGGVVHEFEGDGDVVFFGAEGERFEKEHGGGEDTEVDSDWGVAELIIWHHLFYNSREHATGCIDELVDKLDVSRVHLHKCCEAMTRWLLWVCGAT